MTLIHISSYRYNQNSVALARAHINYLYEDIVIYFRYSNRWNIKNGPTDCGEPLARHAPSKLISRVRNDHPDRGMTHRTVEIMNLLKRDV